MAARARSTAPASAMAEARRALDEAKVSSSARRSFLGTLGRFVMAEGAEFAVRLSEEELSAWISAFALISKHLQERGAAAPEPRRASRARASPPTPDAVLSP